MRRGWKILGVIGIGVIVLLAGLAVLLPRWIDPNAYRDDLILLVKASTGRDLVIRNDIEFTIFPVLGLKLGPVTLSNAPGFGDQPFASVQKAQLQIRLLPLLAHRIEFGTLSLDGLDLAPTVQADGSNNWSSLLQAVQHKKQAEQQQGRAPAPPQAAQANDKGGFSIKDASLKAIEIKNAHVHYLNLASQADYELSALNLQTGRISGDGAAFAVKLEFDLRSARPQLGGHLKLDGEGRLDTAAQRYALRAAKLEGGLQSPALGPNRLDLSGGVSILADLAQGTAQLDKLTLKSGDFGLNGDFEVSHLNDKPQWQGHLEVPTFSARALLTRLGVKLPTMADAQALSRVALQTRLAGNGQRLTLDDLHIIVDDTRAEGSAGLRLGGAVPGIDLDVRIDRLDLDRYLPPHSQEKSRAAATEPVDSGTGKAAEQLLPLGGLRKFDTDSRLAIGEFKLYNVRMSQALVQAHLQDGALRLHPFQTQLYGGSYQGDIRVTQPASEPATLGLDEHLNGIRLGDLLKDLATKPYVSGTGSLVITLNSEGRTMADLRAALNGRLELALQNGRFLGLDVLQRLQQAYNDLHGGASAGTTSTGESTGFAVLKATAQVNRGVLRNEDLAAQSPVLRITGKGEIDLVRQRIDYLLSPMIVNPQALRGSSWLDQLQNRPLPIRIRGDLKAPQVQLDLAEALKGRLGDQGQKLEQRLEKTLPLDDQGRERLRQGLQRLFNRNGSND